MPAGLLSRDAPREHSLIAAAAALSETVYYYPWLLALLQL
jgi:hypothetical protein